MFTLRTETHDNIEIHVMSGVINEDVDFSNIFGFTTPPKDLHINCERVLRINSMGIKMWSVYFQALRAAKVRLKFYDCSPAIIEQCGYVANFIRADEIVSLGLRFFCQGCSRESVVTSTPAELKALKFRIPSRKCENCGANADFDEIADEYFSFINLGT